MSRVAVACHVTSIWSVTLASWCQHVKTAWWAGSFNKTKRHWTRTWSVCRSQIRCLTFWLLRSMTQLGNSVFWSELLPNLLKIKYRAHFTTRGERSKPMLLFLPIPEASWTISVTQPSNHPTTESDTPLFAPAALCLFLLQPCVFSTAIYRVSSSSCFLGVKSYYCSKRLLGCISAVCQERYPPATLITHHYLENTNSES